MALGVGPDADRPGLSRRPRTVDAMTPLGDGRGANEAMVTVSASLEAHLTDDQIDVMMDRLQSQGGVISPSVGEQEPTVSATFTVQLSPEHAGSNGVRVFRSACAYAHVGTFVITEVHARLYDDD